MGEEVDKPVLEYLRHIRAVTDETRQDIRDLKTRVGFLEQQYASISSRMDRVDLRLERIETRIGLIDA